MADPIADVTQAARDALYLTVGLGVLGFQSLQVRRQELRTQLQSQIKVLEQRLSALEDMVTRP